MVTMNERIEINAAIERLLADGAAFDSDDAAVLIRMVPLASRATEIKLSIVDSAPRNGMEGFAPGHGRVRIEDREPRIREYGLSPEVTRVGGYKLVHVPGEIEISLMWAETKLDLNGVQHDDQTAKLVYDRRSKRPLSLKRAATIPIQIVLWPKPLVRFELQLTRFVVWKVPGPPGGDGDARTVSRAARPRRADRDGPWKRLALGLARARVSRRAAT